MDDTVRERHKLRLEVLSKAYEMSGGDTSQFINAGQLAQALGMLEQATPLRAALEYLNAEGLVELQGRRYGGVPGIIKLTHFGLKEMEQSKAAPDQPTEHFPAQNILYVGTMIGSTVQQGIQSTQTSTQNVTLTEDGKKQLLNFVAEVEAELSNLSLSSDALDEMRADLATIKLQANSTKPKSSILKECLTSAKHILEHATGAATGYAFYHNIPALLALVA
jgi:hypothetical protein